MELLILDEKYRQIVTLIKEVIFSDIISDDYIINEVYDENYDNYIIKDNNDEDTENENDNNNNIYDDNESSKIILMRRTLMRKISNNIKKCSWNRNQIDEDGFHLLADAGLFSLRRKSSFFYYEAVEQNNPTQKEKRCSVY